jgi:two-component system heavy metal sensor histidine kinase CusS
MEKSRHFFDSITTRLVFICLLGCMVAIGITGWCFRSALSKKIEQDQYELLINHVTWLRNSILENADDPKRALESLMTTASRDPVYVLESRLVNSEGKVVFATSEIDDLPPITQFRAQLKKDQDLVIVRGEENPKDGSNEYQLAARLMGVEQEGLIYQAIRKNDREKEWTRAFDTWWLGLLIIGGIAAALVGWWMARRALSPLARMTDVLNKITAKNLNDRLDADKLPDEVQELALEFNRMLTRLQQSFRQLSQFTADAAHEFRTPLNNLLGATSLALSKERSREEYTSLLLSHVEQFQRLNRMIESLLFLARADHSSAGFQPQSVDVGACAREVMDFFSAVAEDRGVHLQVRGEATTLADESMLRIAISNLVSNGLRFTPAGQSLKIIVDRTPQQQVTISVIDSGPGIATEHYEHIFDRFYRLEKSRTTEGAGLGLSIVQTIMQLHGGKAIVDRAPHGGAIFTLHFPPTFAKTMEHQD